MEWNQYSSLIRFGISGMALALVLMAGGCSSPSRITVTGLMPVSEEAGSAIGLDEVVSPNDGAASVTAEENGPGVKQGPSVENASGLKQLSPAENASKGETDSGSEIAVYVCGEVVKPGVYYLPSGSRICDALDAAGGFTDRADQQWLNQAQTLADGQMLVAYTREETAAFREQGQSARISAPGSVSAAGSSLAPGAAADGMSGVTTGNAKPAGGSNLVNLNTASQEELMSLPGIGEAKADAIIRYRTETGWFSSTEDVMNISGIKNSTYEKIRDRITV